MSLWLTIHPIVYFSTAYIKNVRNIVPLRTETLFPFVHSRVNNGLHQTNLDFTSHFLTSSTFINVFW